MFACSGFNGGFTGTGLDVIDVTNKGNLINIEPDPDKAVETVRAQVSAYLSALQGLGAVEPGYLLVEAEASSGVTILVGFRPAGWAEPLSFKLHQTAGGCRVAPTVFAPVMESCA